jgi:ligand-binding SRPBCC domain-containing protein
MGLAMTVRFDHETFIEAPAEIAFDLSLDVDVHRSSMSASNERAVAGVTTGRICFGETVTWRATHFGIPFTMTSKVTALERPHRFVDEQVRGPFRSFRHEHLFDAVAGGTRMVDRVGFDAPLGPIGRLAERAALATYLERLIAVRGDHLKAAAERRHRAGTA